MERSPHDDSEATGPSRPSSSGQRADPAVCSGPPDPDGASEADAPQVVLTPVWVIVGTLAALLGGLMGLVMSAAAAT